MKLIERISLSVYECVGSQELSPDNFIEVSALASQFNAQNLYKASWMYALEHAERCTFAQGAGFRVSISSSLAVLPWKTVVVTVADFPCFWLDDRCLFCTGIHL